MRRPVRCSASYHMAAVPPMWFSETPDSLKWGRATIFKEAALHLSKDQAYYCESCRARALRDGLLQVPAPPAEAFFLLREWEVGKKRLGVEQTKFGRPFHAE